MITVTVTGNPADDPHTFRTGDGRFGCDLRLAVDLPPRGATGDSQVRTPGSTPAGSRQAATRCGSVCSSRRPGPYR
jgi:hypothetical protein